MRDERSAHASGTTGRPRAALVLLILFALVLVACGDDDEPGLPGEGTTPVPAPGPAPPPGEADEEGAPPDGDDRATGDEGEDTAAEPLPGVEQPFSRIEGVIDTEDIEGAEGVELWQEAVPEAQDVRIESTVDGSAQPAMWVPPPGPDRPLLVVVHSWSFGYTQSYGIPLARWALDHGWAMIHPDFRGTFDDPLSNGSDVAIQDVVDAVDHAIAEGRVDRERVYVLGFSGGGQMSLLVAGRQPDRFAGAVSFVPIYDLVAWHQHNRGPIGTDRYADEIESACGGDPTVDEQARADCLHRSPVSHLGGARDAGIPVYLGHGVNDQVAFPDNAARAFNDLARPGDELPQDVVASLAGGELPAPLHGSIEAQHHFGDPDPAVVFTRGSGSVTLVLFEGEHDLVFNPGLRWLYELAGGDVDPQG